MGRMPMSGGDDLLSILPLIFLVGVVVAVGFLTMVIAGGALKAAEKAHEKAGKPMGWLTSSIVVFGALAALGFGLHIALESI